MRNNVNGIVLLGPPGSGKSTIGKIVAKKLGMIYISSGDIARKLAESDEYTRESLSKGGMASEDLMRDTIYKMLYTINVRNGMFVLDGFPRSEDQWKWVSDRFPATQPVFINTPIFKCVSRLKARNREDDISSVTAYRMDNYMEHTQPMINKHMGGMITINNTIGIDVAVTELIGRLSDENL
jgi:adenylate kinase family enzyme